jgi:hypothetical protein
MERQRDPGDAKSRAVIASLSIRPAVPYSRITVAPRSARPWGAGPAKRGKRRRLALAAQLLFPFLHPAQLLCDHPLRIECSGRLTECRLSIIRHAFKRAGAIA